MTSHRKKLLQKVEKALGEGGKYGRFCETAIEHIIDVITAFETARNIPISLDTKFLYTKSEVQKQWREIKEMAKKSE